MRSPGIFSRRRWRQVVVASLAAVACGCSGPEARAVEPARAIAPQGGRPPHRSPVDLALDPTGKWLLTANQTSDSVSLIRVADGEPTDEIACGSHPADVAWTPDGRTALVSCSWSGTVEVIQREGDRLRHRGPIDVGFEPCGLAIASAGTRAFVGLVASGEVAEIDWSARRLVRRIAVGEWPRYLTLSHDDQRLAVGCAGASQIAVVDTDRGEVLYEEPLVGGINLGQMVTSPDGAHAYFTWMVYRTNPITVGNIRRGWVLASPIGRVRLDGESYREAISLDVPGRAVADPHGLVISPDGSQLVASAAGTHELLVYRLPDLPMVGIGGPGDLIDRGLQNDRARFRRIELGGRPLGLQWSADGRQVYVANFLKDAVQVVDLESDEVVQEIALGGPPVASPARRGMAIFFDGQRSLDQWYSCHSCHQEGGSNARAMDTMNDGSTMTQKTVLPLYDVTRTGPWTWHGWQTDLDDAMQKSLTVTMLGDAPSEADKEALIAYLDQLQRPPNPYRRAGPRFAAAAARGKAVFESAQAGCADCHHGPAMTDNGIHDVGLGTEADQYEGYNTPSLRGVYRKVRLLHRGQARSLEEVLSEYHRPAQVAGEGTLSEQQQADLVAYLQTL